MSHNSYHHHHRTAVARRVGTQPGHKYLPCVDINNPASIILPDMIATTYRIAIVPLITMCLPGERKTSLW